MLKLVRVFNEVYFEYYRNFECYINIFVLVSMYSFDSFEDCFFVKRGIIEEIFLWLIWFIVYGSEFLRVNLESFWCVIGYLLFYWFKWIYVSGVLKLINIMIYLVNEFFLKKWNFLIFFL